MNLIKQCYFWSDLQLYIYVCRVAYVFFLHVLLILYIYIFIYLCLLRYFLRNIIVYCYDLNISTLSNADCVLRIYSSGIDVVNWRSQGNMNVL